MSRPSRHLRVRDILDEAPRELDELPAWFASLDAQQLDSVWVGAIVDAVTRCPVVRPADMARALTAVRDRMRRP